MDINFSKLNLKEIADLGIKEYILSFAGHIILLTGVIIELTSEKHTNLIIGAIAIYIGTQQPISLLVAPEKELRWRKITGIMSFFLLATAYCLNNYQPIPIKLKGTYGSIIGTITQGLAYYKTTVLLQITIVTGIGLAIINQFNNNKHKRKFKQEISTRLNRLNKEESNN